MAVNRIKILAIDDKPDNLTVLKAVIADALPGAEVFAAGSGQQGLELALAQDPDVILLDIVMPEMDGYEVCRRLKADARLKLIPVVFLTAIKTNKESRIKALEAGGEGFLPKPLEEAELIAQIRAMVKIKAGNVALLAEQERLKTELDDSTNKLSDEACEHQRTKKAREAAEAGLRASEARLREITDMALGVVYEYRLYPDGRSCFPYSSEGMNDIYEVTPEEVREDAAIVFGRIHPDDLKRVSDAIYESARTLKDFYCELRMVLPRQGLRWRVSQAKPQRLPDGSTLWYGTITDITERKLAEETLKASQSMLRQTEQIGKVGGWSFEVDTLKQVWTEEVYRIHELEIGPDPSVEKGISYYTPESRPIIERAVQRAIEHGEGFDLELEIITAKANRRWVHTIGRADMANRRIYGFFQDITEGKKSEVALSKAEADNRITLQNLPIGVVVHAPDTSILWSNIKAQEILGLTGDQMAGKKAIDPAWRLVNENLEKLKLEDFPVNKVLSSGKNLTNMTLGIQRPDSRSIAWVTVSGILLRAANGAMERVIVSFVDITDRKRKDQELVESKVLLESVIENVPLMIFLKEAKDLRFVIFNRAGEELLGYDRKALLGKNNLDLFPAEQAAHFMAKDREVLDEKTGFLDIPEESISTANKGDRFLHTRKVCLRGSDGATKYLLGISEDITDRKVAQDRQALYLSVLKRLGDGDASDAVLSDILGYIAKTLDIEAVGIRLERGGDFPFIVTRGFTPDFVEKEKTLCRRLPSGEPARDADGNLVMECTCGAVVCGRLGKDLPFITAGGSLWLKSISSLTPSEVESVTSRLVNFRGRCVDEGYESLALVPLRTKEKTIGLMHFADHRKNRFSLELVEFLEGLGSSVALVLERREAALVKSRLEEQLRQSQKIESVGRLAGGVAHDFNNLLTAIGGYAGFLMRDMGKDDPKREDVKEILAATERAAELTKQLLAFSRKQILNLAVVDLNASIAGIVKMLKRLIGEEMQLQTKFAPQACWAKVDPGQIDQVLVNLAVNARDAMPKGGVLTLETAMVTPDAHFFLRHPGLPQGPLICLTVRDTGCGLTPEAREHLFEPFFTTKGKGQGTGLGLSTVFGIVKQSGGEIEVESKPNSGTTFRMYFPCADAQVSDKDKDNEKVKAKGKDTLLRGSETILLVEDEDMLRRLAERLLKADGYTVITAADGKSALEAAQRHGKPVDLLVTDVVMPGMNGRELATELAKRKLAHRTLYMSGYTDEAISVHGVLEAGIAFIYKPFSPDALSKKLREVLDGPADQAKA